MARPRISEATKNRLNEHAAALLPIDVERVAWDDRVKVVLDELDRLEGDDDGEYF